MRPLEFSALSDPDLPGTIFDDGTDRVTRDLIVLDDPRPITLGRHSCASGTVSATRLKHWPFASAPLAGGHALLETAGPQGQSRLR